MGGVYRIQTFLDFLYIFIFTRPLRVSVRIALRFHKHAVISQRAPLESLV